MLRKTLAAALAAMVLAAVPAPAQAADNPWMNTALSPAQRANLLLAAMTQAEKLTMLHGGPSCGYVGCVPANTRLGIPRCTCRTGRSASATASPVSPSSPPRSPAPRAGTPP